MKENMLINNIKEKNWKYLLIGMQQYFNTTQLGLLDLVGINKNFDISFWIGGRYIPPKSVQLKFIKFIKNRRLVINKLIKLGNLVKKSIKFNNKLYPFSKTVERDYFGNNLIIKINNKKYLNMPLLFPKNRFGVPLKFIILDKNVLVFYNYKFSRSLKPLILPRYIELNKDFLVGLGIYLAEGSRNRHPKITNSEPVIINQAIIFFKLFNFSNIDFKAWIQLHERSTKSLKSVEEFWIKNTSLVKRNIKEIRIKKSTGNAKIKQQGTLHLEINSIIFQLLIENLLNSTLKIIKSCSKQNLIYFLQGAYAGEGSVNIAKSGSANMIIYTSLRKTERTLLKQILNKFEIKASEYNKSGDLVVCGYENIKNLYNLNIFKYHPIRKQKLDKGFNHLSKSQIPGFNKKRIISLFGEINCLTYFELANLLNLSYSCINKHLRELYYKNIIGKINGSGSLPNKWYLRY